MSFILNKGVVEINKQKTTEEFISQAKTVHGDKYDYSKVLYIKAREHVIIICNKHGEFLQTPDKHLSGRGCEKCSYELRAKNNTMSTDEFIYKANKKHNNFYNYKNVNYINSHLKVIIICPKHGEFQQSPTHHLAGHGCPKCKFEEKSGENHHNYNPFLSEEERKFGRKIIKNGNPNIYNKWRKSVHEKHNYTCDICGNSKCKINAHHLDGWHWCKERRFDVSNGVTLCKDCHKDFHFIYGNKNNTEKQYIEFKQSLNIIPMED